MRALVKVSDGTTWRVNEGAGARRHLRVSESCFGKMQFSPQAGHLRGPGRDLLLYQEQIAMARSSNNLGPRTVIVSGRRTGLGLTLERYTKAAAAIDRFYLEGHPVGRP
jgi:hypothetical protein